MGRKANIIKHLSMMGYLVGDGEKSGIYSVSLRTQSGKLIMRHYGEEELNYGIGIVEIIVNDMNHLIKNHC